MCKKSKDKIKVSFVGGNAYQVTGSMTLVESGGLKVLLDCGMIQGGGVEDDYKDNAASFPFKAANIDYLFISHAHSDHSLRTPLLVKRGFKGIIIVPRGLKEMLKIMGYDSAYILSKDAEYLSRISGKEVEPIYTKDDVNNMLEYIREYDIGEKVELSSELGFRFLGAGHIIHSAQIELFISAGNVKKKILFTGDLGTQLPKHYVSKFEPCSSADLVIGECTYAKEIRPVTMKDRQKDLEKIKCIIEETCLEKKGRVLIPIFALDRSQNILTHLYEIFGGCEEFNIPILVDSPLTCSMFKYYETQLEGEEAELYSKVVNWKNVIWVKEYEDSKQWQRNEEPCVILSASGMMVAGRSKTWASKLLPDERNFIIFVGFSVLSSLASNIKDGVGKKFIYIDKVPYANNCNIADLKSFSGHMGRDGLLNYYSSINCEKIALVHGDSNYKGEFAEELKRKFTERLKTTKVTAVNKGTSFGL